VIELEVVSTRRIEAIDITDLVGDRRWPDGLLLLSVPHTTAALVLGEADPGMAADYERVAAQLFEPFEPFAHNRNDNPNAPAHLLSSVAGTQLLLRVDDERIQLGTFQRILLLELDGPKRRRLELTGVPTQPLEVTPSD
jgi:secondary thiamine-phosphate synthase enzyme